MLGKKSYFFNKEGGEINPDLIEKPPLCLSCRKNDDPSEEVFCILNRMGQLDAEGFHCSAYQPDSF
ncbi:MAG: hypothetical protein JW768_01690 [Chitinispirillaceae bacterium]|nr:hypothetical protein [Chitinispirillaceae bacterium]